MAGWKSLLCFFRPAFLYGQAVRHARLPGDQPDARDVQAAQGPGAPGRVSVAIQLAYLVAAILFILGLRNLSSPRTAVLGNALAAGGMLIAVVATLLVSEVVDYTVVAAGIVVGAGGNVQLNYKRGNNIIAFIKNSRLSRGYTINIIFKNNFYSIAIQKNS